jgi:hypothetical protein
MQTNNPILPEWKEARLRNWWKGGDQSAPCIAASVLKPDARLPQTDNLETFWTDVDFIIDRKMSEIDQTVHYGCAVPMHYIDQGSSAMAGVLGCPLEFVDMETVWAHPRGKTLKAAFETALDHRNPIYARIRDLTRRSAEQAKEHHFVAHFALEGMSDLLAALYPIEEFLMDTLDEPEEILRAIEHLSGLWLQAFRGNQGLIDLSGNPGGIGWPGIWAPGKTFPLQEDVAYNLSPDQFRQFLIPVLRKHMTAMDYPFFHLDGIGMLPHLPALLELDELPVIQWVPGAGKWDVAQWHGIIRRITGSGKSIQLYVAAKEVAPLVEAVGPDRLFLIIRDADHENMPCLLEQFRQEVF